MTLRLKRVPTVVYNYQKEEGEDGPHLAAGCGRNCLRSCCLTGAKLPLYAFKKVNKVVSVNKEPRVEFLSSLILGEWENRMQRGLFHYDVTSCETKVIPGKSGFIAQLNEGRHLKKRPTEFRVDKVLQPFDENKFNFTMIGQEEVLFQFQLRQDIDDAYFIPNAPVDTDNSPGVVAINVSPIEYGHVLLIPQILECLPQRIDRESFLLALHMAVEAGDPYFRLGYNSLGAFATINHLHFQAYYFAMPFPVERAPSKRIATTSGGVKISYILNYPVRGLIFECGKAIEDLSNAVSDSCISLQENNIPFNVLIADSGKQIFVFPQCYADKQARGEVSAELLDTRVNPAVWEISGHMVLKRKEDYETASEEKAWRLLAEASLSKERLGEVKELIFEAICCKTLENEVDETTFEESAAAIPQSFEDADAHNGSHAAMVMPV
ncbi:Phosphate metabolism transcription protein [Castilleja foliolosa]|uniref:Phosphate metabolism transcription protein n=1 Tax=Castilleja foliolosa TaxID=1961234 RepID=A0ABD3D4L2_9LAMI